MRTNPISTLSDAEALKRFRLLESSFGADWLSMPGEHPLRLLWRAGLAPEHVSYVMQVTTPQHRNEFQNLEYKLEDACANFRRHSSEGTPGLVMLRLAPNAHVKALASRVRRHLEREQPEAIDVVFLYQPSVRRDSESGEANLTIYLEEIEGPSCRISGDDRRTMFFAGTLLGEPFEATLGFDVLDDKYQYQSGHLFIDASRREPIRLLLAIAGRVAPAPVEAATPAEGLHLHEVSTLGRGETGVVSPRVSPVVQLLVL